MRACKGQKPGHIFTTIREHGLTRIVRNPTHLDILRYGANKRKHLLGRERGESIKLGALDIPFSHGPALSRYVLVATLYVIASHHFATNAVERQTGNASIVGHDDHAARSLSLFFFSTGSSVSQPLVLPSNRSHAIGTPRRPVEAPSARSGWPRAPC